MKPISLFLGLWLLHGSLFAQQWNAKQTDSLVALMHPEEKLAQLYGEKNRGKFIARFAGAMISGKHFATLRSGAVPRLNIPAFTFSDGPRGIVVGRNTCFPVTISRGASFNKALEQQIGEAMGKEARAQGANYFGGVCVNLVRNPKGGRTQETYGEDPHHIGAMGMQLVSGVQSNGVMACVKHFALNNSEDNRYQVNVVLDEKTLREVYLPHFEKIIKQGNAASVMSAYNKFRGAYCGEQPYLLEKILREEWGFKGFVTSDWEWGLRTAVKGIQAGMEVEMPHRKYYGKSLEEALKEGKIQWSRIDTLVKRVVHTKMQYAPFRKTKLSAADREAHRKLALHAAQEGMVLLKNEKVLPVEVKSGTRILMLGKWSKKDNTGDRGSSFLLTHHVVTPLEGIRKYVESKGGRVTCYTGDDSDRIRRLASRADYVVIGVGYDSKDEGECIYKNPNTQTRFLLARSGGDRDSMGLHAKEVKMIRLAGSLGLKSTVVFFGGGVPEMYSWIHETPSLLLAWYPGMEGGNALASILFGDVSPSGKLPVTVFKHESDYPSITGDTFLHYDYLHGYRLAEGKEQSVLFPFGFGLTYSRMQITELSTNQTSYALSDTVIIRARLKNEGPAPAAEVVQLYLSYPKSSNPKAPKVLCAFDKFLLRPGEVREIQMGVPVADFRQYQEADSGWKIHSGIYTLQVGNSSASKDLQSIPVEVR